MTQVTSNFAPVNNETKVITEQSPSAVIMVRPHHFTPNPQTAKDNSFQQSVTPNVASVKESAFQQVSQAVHRLRQRGVTVHLFDDTEQETPDSVFPNNWFTTHANGQMGLFPMYCENRRKERKPEIIEFLNSHYRVEQMTDYTYCEQDGVILEGTGSMVLDNSNRIAYAVKSKRMNETLFAKFCEDFGYQGVAFDASDNKGVAVYHTNVLMCIGSEFAMVGLSLIDDLIERDKVRSTLENSGKEVIELSFEQIQQFAGNALELNTENGRILAISQTAYNALTQPQIRVISKYVELFPLDVSTLELAGGSIRCMLAGIHLEKN